MGHKQSGKFPHTVLQIIPENPQEGVDNMIYVYVPHLRSTC